MAFFGAISLILAVLGIGFMIPVLMDYARTGLVDRFPTLIVCGFVLMTAIISFFSGMILQTIAHKNRQDFEMELQRVAHDFK